MAHDPDDAAVVYVRAQSPSGRWWSAPAMDLDDVSFRAFVMDRMVLAGLVTAVRVSGGRRIYRTTTEPPERAEGLSKSPPAESP